MDTAFGRSSVHDLVFDFLEGDSSLTATVAIDGRQGEPLRCSSWRDSLRMFLPRDQHELGFFALQRDSALHGRYNDCFLVCRSVGIWYAYR